MLFTNSVLFLVFIVLFFLVLKHKYSKSLIKNKKIEILSVDFEETIQT